MARRKPPARVRYEQGNPTISCRVPLEFKRELSQHLQKTGQSFSRWIQASFRGDDPAVAEAERAYWHGWEEGAVEAVDRMSFSMIATTAEGPLVDAVLEAYKRSYEAEDKAEAILYFEAKDEAIERLVASLVAEARKPGRTG